MMALSEFTRGTQRASSGGPLRRSAKERQGDRANDAQFVADELAVLRRDHAKLQQAIFEAAQIQRKLCAPREHTWGELEVAGEIFPVRHLSGDFFKVMELGSTLGAVLGDIAGKGLSAGVWQTHLMGVVQRAARQHEEPNEAIAAVNRELCLEQGVVPLTALFFARIDGQTSELAYCNAGLPAPMLLRMNGSVERLTQGGPLLGAVADAKFRTGRVGLQPGDMVVAYSDGVTESRNQRDEEFAMERLAASAQSVARLSATKALFSLLATVLDFADSCLLHDDLTLLVIRRRDTLKGDQEHSQTKGFSDPPRRLARTRRQRDRKAEDTVAKR